MKDLIMKTLFLLTLVLFAETALSQDIAFREDFNDNSRKWSEDDNDSYMSKVEDGHYSIFHKRESGSYFFWKSIIVDPDKDFSIEAAITQISGVDNNGYGILWGAQDVKNCYMFAITTNGYFKVAKYENGTYTDIQKWQTIKGINEMGKANTLLAKHKGSHIYFYVNGNEVFNTNFAPFFGSNMGFVVNDKMTIQVDYLEVRQDGMQINLVNNPINGFAKENLGKNVNSEYDEIMPVISPDGKTLYVTRKKHPGNTGSELKDDIWYATRNEDGTWGKLKNIGKPLNNTGYNSVISVSPDGNTLMLMNTYTKDGEPLGSGISISNKTNDGWEIPKTMEIQDYYNNDNYVEFCLSANKKILIMAVQRSDSYGKRDLYVSFEENGIFSVPKNLGPVVNSFNYEISPFLASDNMTLYYSSNGKPGYGDNDIFVTRRLDDSWTNWSQPKNLGPEINTPSWDAYYSIPASGEYAYLVSSDHSFGKADIFRIKPPEDAKPKPVILVFGKVFNSKTKEPIEASIKYNNLATDEEMGTALSNPATGAYTIVLPYGQKYSFFASREGYYPVSENIDASAITAYEEIEQNLLLSPVEVGSTIRLNNIFFDTDKATLKLESYPELNRLVEFLNINFQVKIALSGYTDNQGSDDYNIALSEARVKTVSQYLIQKGITADRFTGKGYGESKPVATNDTPEGRALNRRVEFTFIEVK